MARRRKKRSKGSKEEPKELVKAPHSFVIHRGSISKKLEQLLRNVRQIMEPFTASKLKVRKKNTIKDFVSISSYLNVNYMIIFTESSIAPYMRLCRVPRGPTITYKILNCTLAQDVLAGQRKPHINTKLFHNAPLLVLNGFGSESADKSIQLQTSMWRNMFPTIDIQTVQLSKIHRCLLLSLDSETNQIELRHYAIKVRPVGLTKMVRKLVTGKKIPDLGQFHSVEEAMEHLDPDSEFEDDDEQMKIGQVTLPQKVGNKSGNLVNEKSSIKLYEIGPRILMELVKVENGIMSGEVLFHKYVQKTNEEIVEQKKKIEQRNCLKLSRKRQQEENVRRKQEKMSANRKRTKPDEESEQSNECDDDNDNDDDDNQPSSSKTKRKKFESFTIDNNDDNDIDNEECSDYQISDDEMNVFNDDDEDDE
ncbi:brix domain-containing protein peter pan [Dermatophagoides pteronyssinus]|uniref:brix domain-containing protein peter pan n=1 Tax=Dermatophagoides pteronyssinus TaxID=6956 RepID=UPI003F67F398